MPLEITLTINGVDHRDTVDDRMLLVDLLRDRVGLTGTKIGCGHGVCGSCTVHVDGVAVRSCLTLAAQADGRTVTTVEALADGDDLHPLQAAFQACHGLQCGFCTPGFLMTATALLEQGLPDDPEATREALAGNLCRCTGYQGIVDAVVQTAHQTAQAEGVDR